MNHNHQIYRDRRARGRCSRCARRPAAASRSCRPRRKSPRNRDSTVPVSARQLFLLHVGLSGARGGRRARRRRRDGDRHVLFCREKNEEREIWDGFRYGPDAAREIFGFDEAHPIAELDRDAARPRGRPARAVHAARAVRRVGPQGHRPAERGARPRAHRRRRARGDRRRAAGARRAAAREGRARARADAPRRRDLRGRASARDGAHARRAGTSTRSRPSSRTSSCAAARRRSPIRRSSPAAPTPACCTTATTTGSCRTASCC